jgi:hypothetical protein
METMEMARRDLALLDHGRAEQRNLDAAVDVAGVDRPEP